MPNNKSHESSTRRIKIIRARNRKHWRGFGWKYCDITKLALWCVNIVGGERSARHCFIVWSQQHNWFVFWVTFDRVINFDRCYKEGIKSIRMVCFVDFYFGIVRCKQLVGNFKLVECHYSQPTYDCQSLESDEWCERSGWWCIAKYENK